MPSQKQKPSRMPGHYQAAEPMPIIFAVMGITGVGKSTFIQAAGACQPRSGKVPIIGDRSLRACTIDTDLFNIPGTNINLMDTPGFDDTFSNDSDILSRIANCLGNFHNERIPISGILYLHPIDSSRMKGSDMKNLQVFREIVGMKHISNCFFVTTKWSKVDKEEGELREEELVKDGSFWKMMLDQGAHVERFSGTRESAIQIINSLCRVVDPNGFITQLTVEYSIEGRSLKNTTAGAIVNEEVAEVRRELGEQITALRKDREDAERRYHAAQEETEKIFEKRQAELAAQLEAKAKAEAKKFEEAQRKLEEKRSETEKKWALTHNEMEEKQRKADALLKVYERKQNMEKDKLQYGLTRFITLAAGGLITVATGGLAAPLALGVYGLAEAAIDDDKKTKGYK